jgi:hypothetical protein
LERKFTIYDKLNALNQLGKHIGMWGTLSKNPYLSGEKPYEKEIIMSLVRRAHMPISDASFAATSMLLNWYLPNWKDFVSPEVYGRTLDRDSREVRRWTSDVYQRDNNSCVQCGSKTNLHAHHICSWAEYPSLRTSIENGVTLCGNCHSKEHPKMGVGMFTKNDMHGSS